MHQAGERKIRWIVTHVRPDLDALLSVFLIMAYGRRHNPPLLTRFSELHFGELTDQIRAWGKERYVQVDTRGGEFDHHDSDSPYRSTAELLGKDLHIEHWKGVAELIKLATQTDAGIPTGTPLDGWIRILNWHQRDNPETVYRFFAELFRGVITLHKNPSLPIRFNLAERIKTFAGPHLGSSDVLKDLLVRSRKNPQDRSKAVFKVQGLMTALEVGSSSPEELDQFITLLLQAHLAWEQQLKLAEIEAGKAELRHIGTLRVIVGRYTSERFTEVIRRRYRPDVIISSHQTTNHTGIVTHPRSPLKLGKVAEAVRLLEVEHRPEWSVMNGVALDQVGSSVSWYLDGRGEKMLLCGSRTQEPEFGPSRIPFEKLVATVCNLLETQNTEPQLSVSVS